MAAEFTPYLSFDGTCEEAFKFYEATFRGKLLHMMRYSEAPAGMGPTPSSDEADRIMHARLVVGDRVLMGADAPKRFASKPQGFCVSCNVEDPAEADRVFGALAQGGQVQMPIGETFWAKRFGMTIDRFGTPWMVNCEARPA